MSLTGGTFKSVRLLPIERILVRLNAAATTNAKIAMLVRDLKIVAPGASVTLLSEELISVQTASETLSLIFLLITAVVMIVAFFSLNTSMYTNIKEQAKEIGYVVGWMGVLVTCLDSHHSCHFRILRALGIDRFVIFRLYGMTGLRGVLF